MLKKILFSWLVFIFICGSAYGLNFELGYNSVLDGSIVYDFESVSDVSFTSMDFGDFSVQELNNMGNFGKHLNVGTPGICYGSKCLYNEYGDVNAFEIAFTDGVTAFGFDMSSINYPWRISAFDSAGNPLGMFTNITANSFYTMYVDSGENAISSLKFFVGWNSDMIALDNFHYHPVSSPAPVPEPSTVLLLGMGLGLLGLGYKKKKTS